MLDGVSWQLYPLMNAIKANFATYLYNIMHPWSLLASTEINSMLPTYVQFLAD